MSILLIMSVICAGICHAINSTSLYWQILETVNLIFILMYLIRDIKRGV